MKQPRVSIIIATYNRCHVLATAIRSVMRQSMKDWELLVIGDACTDGTEKVVRSFSDCRIRFINLEQNCGDQSGPNNVGMETARGEFVAFLNHDDLWYPDHLESALAAFDPEFDLVFSLMEERGPDGSVLAGATPSGRYEPYLTVPASCWVFRRGLFGEIGPWKSPRKTHVVPSVDWLFRAFRSGKSIRLNPVMTAAKFSSVLRPRSYLQADDEGQAAYLDRVLEDPGFRERRLTEIASEGAGQAIRPRIAFHAAEMVRGMVRRLMVAWGYPPSYLRNVMKYRRRGGKVADLRRVRGLGPIPEKGASK